MAHQAQGLFMAHQELLNFWLAHILKGWLPCSKLLVGADQIFFWNQSNDRLIAK
jgi:hypothetical protein